MSLAREATVCCSSDCCASSLPHGWEKISDAHYGVYYIDHINKRTQYERPYELELTKGANGFGFTLIELDRGLAVVKNIIPGGPAYLSGIIQPGDVLVSVSGVSVSGLQHSDVARLFATFTVGDRVKLTFARGYQLLPEMQNTIDDSEFEYFAISITKGTSGFGFTISDGTAGQKVRKILDIERCGNLRQGDLLVSVNGINIARLPHTEVVEVLKNCSIGDTVNITIKRRKRFRSKTPVNLQPSFYGEKENHLPPARNCKTPSLEMMMRSRDTNSDWFLTDRKPTQGPPQQPNGGYHHNSTSHNYNDQQNAEMRYRFDENLNPTDDVNMNNQHVYSNGDYADSYDMRPGATISRSAPQLLQAASGILSEDDYEDMGLPTGDSMHNLSQQQLPPSSVDMDISLSGPGSPLNMSTDDEYEYYRVVLTRTEAGFGFRIVGGAEEGCPIAIGSVVIGGVAYQDGILKSGDEIISINDRNVVGSSHHHVVELMGQCGLIVSLLVRRKKDSDAFEVVLDREDIDGFGFVIISCGNCALIGRIIEGSPAQRCQRLRIRDRIIAINGQDITNMSHPEIVNMIKESGRSLRLKIIPSDCYTVELVRGPRGFGFSIRGGAEFKGMPLFILRIAPDGPAYTLLNVGDEIIEINSVSTVGMTHSDAVQIISQSGPQVKLKLRRNPVSPLSLPNGTVDYGDMQQEQHRQQQQHQQQHQQQLATNMTPSMSYHGGFPGQGSSNTTQLTSAYAPFPYAHSAPSLAGGPGHQQHSPAVHEAHHVNTYSSP